MSEKIKINIPVIVEGRYDKSHLSSVIDGMIIQTDGFGVFKNAERRALMRRLGERGLVLLCDSDGGGRQIRSHLRGMLSGITVYDLYVPQIKGKERRKAAPSAEGILGVEGIPSHILREVFERFALSHPEFFEEKACGTESSAPVTRGQMYSLGLLGGENSSEKRDILCKKLGLPTGMNGNTLLQALLMISSRHELDRLMEDAEDGK